MPLDDQVRLTHMRQAAEDLIAFAKGRDENAVRHDRMLLYALVRGLEVLGEAANGISEAMKAEHPEVPWRLIISTRNRLIHGYFDVDPQIVWNTVSQEIPALLEQLRAIPEPSS